MISLYYPFFPSDRVRFFDCQHMSEHKQNRKFFEWYLGMLKQRTWSEIKDGSAQQRSPTGPAHGTLNSMLLDLPSFAVTAGCVYLASRHDAQLCLFFACIQGSCNQQLSKERNESFSYCRSWGVGGTPG